MLTKVWFWSIPGHREEMLILSKIIGADNNEIFKAYILCLYVVDQLIAGELADQSLCNEEGVEISIEKLRRDDKVGRYYRDHTFFENRFCDLEIFFQQIVGLLVGYGHIIKMSEDFYRLWTGDIEERTVEALPIIDEKPKGLMHVSFVNRDRIEYIENNLVLFDQPSRNLSIEYLDGHQCFIKQYLMTLYNHKEPQHIFQIPGGIK